MEYNNEFKNQQIIEYSQKLEPLFKYIPYLKQHEGSVTRSLLSGDAAPVSSVPVPVYDSNVLAFVKEAQQTGLVTRNYVYAYGRFVTGKGTVKDERLAVSGAGFTDIDGVIAILSKYVLMGMTKGTMWSIAVEEGIWLHCLIKLKELLEIYDHPLA